MSSKIIPEQYTYFKPCDIAAMCVDVALTIKDKDLGFDKRRELRNKFMKDSNFNKQFKNIVENINTLGTDMSLIIEDENNEKDSKTIEKK